MPKGAYIPESIKRMVTEIYRNNRRIGPTKAREELLGKMKEDGLDKNFGPNFPGVSSVSKLLTEYRDNDEKRSHESKELDKPWRILDIAKYSIPPEILPTVVEAWGWTLAEQVEPLSIREALWVARLYYIHKERMKGVLPKNRRDAFIYTLICLAKAYAVGEIIRELANEPHPEKPEDMWPSWLMDGSVHADLTGNDKVKLKCEFEYQERFPSGVPQFREVEYKIAKSDSKFLKRMGEIRSLEEEKVEKSLAELEQESAYVRELEELLIKKDKALLKGDQAEVKAILEKARAIIAKYKAEEANIERPHNKEG